MAKAVLLHSHSCTGMWSALPQSPVQSGRPLSKKAKPGLQVRQTAGSADEDEPLRHVAQLLPAPQLADAAAQLRPPCSIGPVLQLRRPAAAWEQDASNGAELLAQCLALCSFVPSMKRMVWRTFLMHLVSECFHLLQALKIKNQENSKKNQKPEFFKVNQKFKKYSKNNRKYGGTPVFSEKIDCFLNIF